MPINYVPKPREEYDIDDDARIDSLKDTAIRLLHALDDETIFLDNEVSPEEQMRLALEYACFSVIELAEHTYASRDADNLADDVAIFEKITPRLQAPGEEISWEDGLSQLDDNSGKGD